MVYDGGDVFVLFGSCLTSISGVVGAPTYVSRTHGPR
jgi:hypothetical protein